MPKVSSFLTKFTYLLVITGFFGTKLFTLNLGFFELSIFRIVVFVAFFLFLNDKTNISSRYGVKYYTFLKIWVLYSLFLLITVVDIVGYIKYFIFLFSALILSYFTTLSLTKKEDYIKILKWFEYISLIFASIGVYEIFTGDYRFAQENSFEFYQAKSMLVSTIGMRIPMSVFANPNDFGLFLLFSFFVSLALFYCKNKRIGKSFSLLLSLLFSFLIVATQSRSIFMSLVAGIVIWLYFDFRHWNSSTKLLTILLLFLSASSILSWLIANQDLYIALVSAEEGSDSARLSLIKYGFVILGDTFLLGTNIGNVEAHMAEYTAYTNGVVNIHNWWMEVLVSSGVIIFFYYIRIYIKQLLFFLKHIYKTNDRTVYRINQAFLCFMITFGFGSITSSSIFPTEWMWTAFTIIFAFPEVYKSKNN